MHRCSRRGLLQLQTKERPPGCLAPSSAGRPRAPLPREGPGRGRGCGSVGSRCAEPLPRGPPGPAAAGGADSISQAAALGAVLAAGPAGQGSGRGRGRMLRAGCGAALGAGLRRGIGAGRRFSSGPVSGAKPGRRGWASAWQVRPAPPPRPGAGRRVCPGASPEPPSERERPGAPCGAALLGGPSSRWALGLSVGAGSSGPWAPSEQRL